MKEILILKFHDNKQKIFNIDKKKNKYKFSHLGVRIYMDKNNDNEYYFYPYSVLTGYDVKVIKN